jgi:3-oxoacyl-[acyl-carrier protein] reductase
VGGLVEDGDPSVAAALLGDYNPHAVVLVAEAVPHMRPLRSNPGRRLASTGRRTSRSHFTGCVKRCSCRSGRASRMIVVSSGAALNAGSPLSGGGLGDEQTARFGGCHWGTADGEAV